MARPTDYRDEPCAGPAPRMILLLRRRRRSIGEFHLDAERQPTNASPYVLWRTRELALDRLSALPEVLPALAMDGDGGARVDESAQLDSVLGGHRVADGTGDRKADTAEVQECGVDPEAVGDPTHSVIEDRIAGDPKHAMLPGVPAQSEADHVAGQRAAQRRAVATRRGGDLDRWPPRRLEHCRGPGLKPARITAQSIRARDGRDDGGC